MNEEIYGIFIITNMLWMLFLTFCYLKKLDLKEVVLGLIWTGGIISILGLIYGIFKNFGMV